MKLDRTNQMLLVTVLILGTLAGLRFYESLRPAAALWSIPAVSEPAVSAISYRSPDGEISLERSGVHWTVTAPTTVNADPQKVSKLLRDWAEGLAPDLQLDPHPSAEDLQRYGLDAAQRGELRIEGGAGTLAHVFIGHTIAGGSNYLQRPGRDAVFRGHLPGGFRLTVDPAAWRDSRLFGFGQDDLAGLAIDGTHGQLEFVRIDDADGVSWQGVVPAEMKPSTRALEALGRSLANLKPRRILEGEEAASARAGAGLDSPPIVVRPRTEDGRTWTMRIGARADDSDTVWATIDGDDRLFVLADSVARQFDKSADELRDKTVIRARRDASPRITWSENEARIVVVASGQRDWVVEEPADFQPDPRELGLAANSLMNLQASEVRFEERPRFPKAGPQIELTTDEQTQVLSISPEPDEEGRYLATVAGKEPVFVLRGAVVERLLRTFRGEPTDEPQ